jgi:hypothetical protein
VSKQATTGSTDIFNAIERAALDWIVGHHADGANVHAQLATAHSVSRRNTGQDFYTTFTVSADAYHRLAARRLAGEAWAHIRGLERGMTFLLWANDDGTLVALEGATFGEDISALDFNTAQIEFFPSPEGHDDSFEAPPPSWNPEQVPIRKHRRWS